MNIKGIFHVWPHDYYKLPALGFNAVEISLFACFDGKGIPGILEKSLKARDLGLIPIVHLDWFNDKAASLDAIAAISSLCPRAIAYDDEPNLISRNSDGTIRRGTISPNEIFNMRLAINQAAPNCKFMVTVAPNNKPNSMWRLPWKRKSYKDYTPDCDLIGVDYYGKPLGLITNLVLGCWGMDTGRLVAIPAIRPDAKYMKAMHGVFKAFGFRDFFWYSASGDGGQMFSPPDVFSHPEILKTLKEINEND